MRTGRSHLLTAVIVGLAVGLMAATQAAPGGAASRFTDIETSWAREHIEALAGLGVTSGYPDRTFKPDRPVTRAEFAKMVATAFTLLPGGETTFADLDGHWARDAVSALAAAGVVEPFDDGTFRPDDPLTRADAAAMLVRLLRLHDVTGYASEASFVDVPRNHWAHASVETALRLKILPPYIRGTFEPSLPATRAEVAAMIHETLRLQTTRGSIDYLDPSFRLVGVRHQGGVSDVTLHPETVVHRNTAVAPFENLRVGDAVYVVADRFGSPQFVKANGTITPTDVVTKVSNVTRGLLTPGDLRAIIAGDWAAVTESLKSTIYDELVKRGVSPVEAAAIMSADWTSLQGYARDHLAQIIAGYVGISTDLAVAVLERDWTQARELAQVEAIEQLLGGLLLDATV